MTSENHSPPPFVGLANLLQGNFVAGALAGLAQLGIADLVAAGPRSAADLAREIGADASALYRLMRATASVGVLAEQEDGRFAQTPLSDCLRRDATPSLRDLAIMGGREWGALAWSQIEYGIRTGKPSVDKVYGMPIFEYMAKHPEEAAIFNGAMTSISAIDSPAVAAAYDFSGFGSLVDVGGGHGLLLATILAKTPGLNGILYDLDFVVAGAPEGPLAPYMDRCSLASGDMFATVPAGADAYIMKHIIHDWDDERCIKILKACRAAVNPGGRLLVVDAVIQPGNAPSPSKFLDLQMLLIPGGLERTEVQFRALFAAAGWRLTRVVPTMALDSILEGEPV
jgi:hypothetical protein